MILLSQGARQPFSKDIPMNQLLTSLALLCFVGGSTNVSAAEVETNVVSITFENSNLDQDGERRGKSASKTSRGGGSNDGRRGGGSSVPVDSPEPVTMIALLGGAAAAGSISRRRKKKDQI